MTEVAELKQKVYAWLDARKQETINFCSNLIKIPSENPPGDMSEIMTFIERVIIDCGLVPQTQDLGNGRIVLFSEMGAG